MSLLVKKNRIFSFSSPDSSFCYSTGRDDGIAYRWAERMLDASRIRQREKLAVKTGIQL
jgi:hypothetical protein